MNIGDLPAGQVDPVRLEQPLLAIRTHRRSMRIEIIVETVACMTRDGADTISRPPHSADPVDMPVAVHDHCVAAMRCKRRTNQLPLVRAVPMRSDSAFAGLKYSMTFSMADCATSS